MLGESAVAARARAQSPTRDFTGALRAKLAAGRPAVIGEIKRASPSRGVLRENFDAAAIAKSYAAAGAACLSVLTDREFFQGSIEHLQAARASCSLPALRKDFIVEPYQVYEARAIGADCILLIAASLTTELMKQLEALAQSLGMAVLVEVHDAKELAAALELKTPLLGINKPGLAHLRDAVETTLDLPRSRARGSDRHHGERHPRAGRCGAHALERRERLPRRRSVHARTGPRRSPARAVRSCLAVKSCADTEHRERARALCSCRPRFRRQRLGCCLCLCSVR